MKFKIAPSILSADRKRLQQEVRLVEPYAEMLHVDIMDGKFVPPVTFKAKEIKDIHSALPKDVHLMVEYPLSEGYIDDYIDAGASSITIHEECKDDVAKCIEHIHSKGIRVALTVNPATPVERIFPFLDKIDMVLIMSVHPGYGGQKFIPAVLEKVRAILRLKPEMDIEIDGGIALDTIQMAKEAGANVFVAGNAIFNKGNPIKAIKELRDMLK